MEKKMMKSNKQGELNKLKESQNITRNFHRYLLGNGFNKVANIFITSSRLYKTATNRKANYMVSDPRFKTRYKISRKQKIRQSNKHYSRNNENFAFSFFQMNQNLPLLNCVDHANYLVNMVVQNLV